MTQEVYKKETVNRTTIRNGHFSWLSYYVLLPQTKDRDYPRGRWYVSKRSRSQKVVPVKGVVVSWSQDVKVVPGGWFTCQVVGCRRGRSKGVQGSVKHRMMETTLWRGIFHKESRDLSPQGGSRSPLKRCSMWSYCSVSEGTVGHSVLWEKLFQI